MKYLFAILFVVAPVFAQPYQGYDTLGMAMYCDRYLAAPSRPAVSTLMNTFGDPLPCLDKRAQRGDLKLIQVDLIDATCWRNKVCPPGVPRPDDLRAIKSRASQVRKLKLKYPSVDVWISPALEHDVKDVNTVRKMAAAAKQGCPECQIINSPFMGARPPELEVEEHGTKKRGFMVSSDGASAFDGDNMNSDGNRFEHRTAGQNTTFAWWPELNLRCSGEDKFTPPKLRTAKPTADQFKQADLTLQPEQPRSASPAYCTKVREIEPGKEITKPNAEAYCNGQTPDSRGNKPLLIIKVSGKKGETRDVLRSDGRRIAKFRYWDTYTPMKGTHRWYIGNGSGQAPAALYNDLGGSEWGYLDLGRGSCLRFNAIRRQGVYR